MTGLEYEHHVARYLTNRGYHGVKVTKGSGDYGVDVIAHKHGKKFAVQCKLYTGPVGLSAVQEAVAGKAMYNCDSAMVVTNSTFTKAAHELAAVNGVVLIERVKAGGNHIFPKGVRVFATLAYLFVVSAILAASIEQAKTVSAWQAAYNLTSVVLFVASPFWLYFGLKHLTRLVRRKLRKAQDGPRLSDDPRSTHADPAPKLKLFADPAIVKRHLPDDIVDPDAVANTLCGLEQITLSEIQRKCKYGYARASQILDTLISCGLLSTVQATVYAWTDKAK